MTTRGRTPSNAGARRHTTIRGNERRSRAVHTESRTMMPGGSQRRGGRLNNATGQSRQLCPFCFMCSARPSFLICIFHLSSYVYLAANPRSDYYSLLGNKSIYIMIIPVRSPGYNSRSVKRGCVSQLGTSSRVPSTHSRFSL